MSGDITWLSTAAAAERLGITPRTLYRFIDEGQLAAYKFGRVIRLKQDDVDAYIESCRVEPGSMSHLYPETAGSGEDCAIGAQLRRRFTRCQRPWLGCQHRSWQTPRQVSSPEPLDQFRVEFDTDPGVVGGDPPVGDLRHRRT